MTAMHHTPSLAAGAKCKVSSLNDVFIGSLPRRRNGVTFLIPVDRYQHRLAPLRSRKPMFLALPSLAPGHSHVFNVARRKEGRPGKRNHVSAIAQSLCTPSIEPYPNREKRCFEGRYLRSPGQCTTTFDIQHSR